MQADKNKKFLGAFCVGISALAFALMSMFIKSVTLHGMSAVEVAFARFLLGFVVLNAIYLLKPVPLRPSKPGWVYLRAFFTGLASICFFIGISSTTLVNANLLNMTYPVFVAMLAPFWNREAFSLSKGISVAAAILGIYLVVQHKSGFSAGDIWALLSGMLAAGGISSLKEARMQDTSFIILYYLMVFGLVMTSAAMPLFIIPDLDTACLLILIGVLSLIGQFLITYGYRYVKAIEGSLISTTRVVFAGVLGMFFFSESINMSFVLGAVLIAFSIIWIQARSA